MNFTLEPNEFKIDTWTVIYLSPDGGKYNGKLTVTNIRLLYEAKFDVTVKGIQEEELPVKSENIGSIVIPKNRIVKVETKQSFIKKQMVITLDDGSFHVFDYGMLNIDTLSEAINQI